MAPIFSGGVGVGTILKLPNQFYWSFTTLIQRSFRIYSLQEKNSLTEISHIRGGKKHFLGKEIILFPRRV